MSNGLQRFVNAKNPHQGSPRKVLCICSAGLLRSPTIAWILSNPPFNFNTRAAGIDLSCALIVIDPILVYWADTIVFVAQDIYNQVKAMTELRNKDIRVLNLPDVFGFKDALLVDTAKKELLKVFPPEDRMQNSLTNNHGELP